MKMIISQLAFASLDHAYKAFLIKKIRKGEKTLGQCSWVLELESDFVIMEAMCKLESIWGILLVFFFVFSWSQFSCINDNQ